MLATTVLWAQRTDEIFITIDLMDIENPKVNLTNEKLYFQGRSLGKDYEVELKFFNKIDPEASKQSITPRNAFFVLIKEEKGKEYWPRLLEDKGKVHYLKTDFGRWKDEDDDDDVPNPMEGLDFSQFTGMGGMPGMGDLGNMDDMPDSDDDTSTDDDMPELEKADEKAEAIETKA
jgi:prostaglandin-E synthase